MNDLEKVGYHGKHFTIPSHSTVGIEINPNPQNNKFPIPQKEDSLILQDLNSIWDFNKFLVARKPLSLGILTPEQLSVFSTPDAPRTLDMPIKFPGSNFKLPENLKQFQEVIQMVADYEASINPDCFDEYYCYMTIDQGWVEPGNLQREAPCHVDGFQGARWNPKTKLNHTYVISDLVPTTYYVQPFDMSHLDESKHNFFWEMNKIVADTKSKYAWQPQNGELCLMDAYCVHRGSEAKEKTYRTFLRLSFEVRKFDRLGNAHNPLFKYNWEMVKRDIESLNLVAFDETIDPSLRVFPWQDTDGTALEKGKKTKPKLD